MPVLKPEIKHIANQEQATSLRLNPIQPVNKTLFTCKTCGMVGDSKMQITGEKGFLSIQ
jgi:hypothetical protein